MTTKQNLNTSPKVTKANTSSKNSEAIMNIIKPEVMANWTPYTNTLTWGELSNEQQGLLLLAKHNGQTILMDGKDFGQRQILFDSVEVVYSVLDQEEQTRQEEIHQLYEDITEEVGENTHHEWAAKLAERLHNLGYQRVG